MSSVRRKLFKEGSNSWASETIGERRNNEAFENGRTEIIEYTVINEGDAAVKEQIVENPHGLKTPQENLFRPVPPSFSEKDLEKQILIVHEAENERLRETWTELKTLEGIKLASCHCTDLISVCTKDTFLLIFLDMSSVASNAQKICSTVRYNPSSLNRSVAIIGVTSEGSKEDFSSHGINDILHLPVTEETMNQVLLKWARHKCCEGMPLTPQSPEDQVQVVGTKGPERSKENAEEPSSSLVHYSPSLQLQGFKNIWIRCRIHRMRVDGSSIWKEKVVDSKISRYDVWKGPKELPFLLPCVPRAERGLHELSAMFYTSCRQNCGNAISQAVNSVATSESFCKPTSLQRSQPESCYQEPFHNTQCVPADRGSFGDLTQTHHLTNDDGLQQHNGHVSNINVPQHFAHGGNLLQEPPPPSLFIPRSAPDHISTQGGLLSTHITGMVNQVYSEHCNQGYVYHNIQSSDPSRVGNFPQHFIPVNPPPLCPNAHGTNSGGFSVGHMASKAEHPAASTQASPDCDGTNKMVGTPAYMISGALGSKDMKITLLRDDLSKHSSKERVRRERIKESCDQLRFLLPSVAGKKSDMASILEMTVKYVRMIKERLPAAVLQEISQNIADTTLILPRKRANRDVTTIKQARPRLAPTSSANEAPPRLPHPLPPFYMRSVPLQGKAPAMVTTTGPMYVPHLHIRPGYEHAQMPLQQHHVHQTEPASFRPATSPPSAFNSCHTVGNIRSANSMQHHSPHEHATMNLHQEYSAPHSSFHPKHIYHGNHPTVPSVPGHSYDMPQQWSFLKLPPIGNIFHSLSSSNLCQESAKQDSCESGRSSPTDSSSMTPPLWESSGSVIGNRQDHGHMDSPIMFKGTSM